MPANTVRTRQPLRLAVLTESPPAPIVLDSVIPRRYVHKAAQAEVLLSDWRKVDEDTFVVAAQWPRAHAFYSSDDGLYDPLLLAETVRQTIPLLSHVAYDVPFGHHLIWEFFSYEVDTAALVVGATPADVELRIACHDITRRRNGLSALTMQVAVIRDGATLGTATARFTSNAPAIYRRLRAGSSDPAEAIARAIAVPPPVVPVRAGRDRFLDVVLSPADEPYRWQLRTDTDHPVLFDHPVDHAPGMLLLEAVRQAMHAISYPRRGVLVGLDTVFTRYAELDAPCWIEATDIREDASGRTTARVTALQHDQVLFTAVATSEPRPSAVGVHDRSA
ncbi:transcriptional regulator (plasmid) [Streptomyces sp. NBC_00435]|uniref:ScbA/BarX family gamma-butyrolactone biosynthesis protein n=1 Tax=Streptomyces sp. NBC_00435 TaxID=2903649 RepID=UPI002E20E608